MTPKAYISEISSWWTIARQEEKLAAAIPGWPDAVAIFRDELTVRERRGHSADSLPSRAAMLRASTRKVMPPIYVAALPVLAWEEDDLKQLIAQTRKCDLIALDEGLTIKAGKADVRAIIAAWKASRRRSHLEGAQLKGAKNSAANRRAKAKEGAERVRQYWGMPSDDWPTKRLREMAGEPGKPMAYNTLTEHLGCGRETAQKRYQAAEKRKITRQQKKK